MSGLKSGADLAADAGSSYAMVDMVNIPEAAKEQMDNGHSTFVPAPCPTSGCK